MDINKKMAELRTEADKSYTMAKDLKKDAAETYQKVDRMFTAKSFSEVIKKEFMRLGHVALEPDIINGAIEKSLKEYIEIL